MRVYCIMDSEGYFLCKKAGKVYISNKDLDRMLTYRRLSQLKNIIKDDDYWKVRDIDIESFNVRHIKLKYDALIL